MSKEFFVKNSKLKESNDDDDEALADGLIPDSRIVQIIGDLETNHDELDNNEDPEIKLKSLGLNSSKANWHRLAG